MSIVVFGGSGQIGRYLLPRLQRDERSIIAFSRIPHASGAGVVWMRGALPDDVPALPPAEAVVSLGPLDHFAEWFVRAGPEGPARVVAMSSMSAESKRESPDAGERDLAARLRAAESRLIEACEARGCAWTILRATLIYGAGIDRSLTPLAVQAMRRGVCLLPRGNGLRQPVHAADLAAAVYGALAQPRSAGQVIAIGGGERLSASAMFQRVHASLRGRRRWLPLPLPLPTFALRLASAISGRGRGIARRLDEDLVADNARAQALLDVTPRDFAPSATTWTEGDPD